MIPDIKPNSMLYLNNVSVSFDGFKALNALSIVIEPGELRAIIGPNGAGKTTMMDIITGKTRPDEGEVFFNGQVDLTKKDEADIAQLGIGRKFQKPTVFESHTVWDNLELALNRNRGVFATLFYRLTPADRDRIAVGVTHTAAKRKWSRLGVVAEVDLARGADAIQRARAARTRRGRVRGVLRIKRLWRERDSDEKREPHRTRVVQLELHGLSPRSIHRRVHAVRTVTASRAPKRGARKP